MQKVFRQSVIAAGLILGAAACTDEGEKSWPSTTTTGGASSSSAASSASSASSSSGEAGAGGNGGSGGMAGAGVGGAGGAGGNGGMGGAGGAGGGAPENPMNLTVVIAGKDVKLDWVKSAKPTSRIVRKEGSAPTGPDDPSASVVYEGPGITTSEPLRNLLPTTPTDPRTYHYAVYGCDGSCGGDPAADTLSPTIMQCLAGGGYNIIWRHASADVCSDNTGLGTAANTSYPDWWKRCDANCPQGQPPTATARQLNAAGLNESDAIGNSLAARGIPFGRMLSSEYCRCLKTAELMSLVPLASIEQNQDITYYVYDEANRCNNTMALLAVEPPAGANTGLVGHGGFVCPTLGELAWAEAAIYKPNGMGGSTFIARVHWNAWDALP